MVTFVDKRRVNSSEGERGKDGRPWLRASDITTFVSIGLVIVRFITSTWTALLAWRCAFFLLETDGLTLPQFNEIVSWGFHFPKFSKHYLISAAALALAAIPSIFAAPVLAGAVDWRDSYFIIDRRGVEYRRVMPDDDWYWFTRSGGTVRSVVVRATGFSLLGWSDTIHKEQETCRHALSVAGEMPVNSTVENATIPCIEIHDINWDDQPGATDPNLQEVFDTGGTKVSQAKDDVLRYFHPGNAILFNPRGSLDLSEYGLGYKKDRNYSSGRIVDSYSSMPDPKVFTGVMTVAVLIAVQPPEEKCNIVIPTIFGNASVVKTYKKLFSGGSEWNCFRTGTVNVTAGVLRKQNATYVSPRVIESKKDTNSTIEGHEWVLPAISLLPDVMVRVSGANLTSLETWNNIDEYTKRVIRQSYMGTWSAMYEDFSRESEKLTASEQARLLEATVSILRVRIWFALHFMVTISGIAVYFMQRGVDHPVVFDGAAVSLMVDAKPALDTDTRSWTRMSYVTGEDSVALLHLKAVDNPRRFELQSEPKNKLDYRLI